MQEDVRRTAIETDNLSALNDIENERNGGRGRCRGKYKEIRTKQRRRQAERRRQTDRDRKTEIENWIETV